MKTIRIKLTLLLIMMAVNTYAIYTYVDDGITYVAWEDRGEAWVWSGKECSGEVVIPDETFGGDIVTAIACNAFEGNDKITSVIVGNNVKTIYGEAFWNCKNLKTVTLGKKVEKIGGGHKDFFEQGWLSDYFGAFSGCNKIEKVISLIERIMPIESKHFDGEVYYNAQLMVPIGQKEKYKKAAGWKNFLSIEEYDFHDFFSKHNLTYYVDGDVYQQYQLGYEEETITPDEKPWKRGYYFSGWSEIPSVMPTTDVNVTAIFTPKSTIPVYGIKGQYATFYHEGAAYSLPKGVIAQVVTNVEGSRITYKTIADGDQTMNVIPKGVPVLLKFKDKATSIHLTVSQSDATYTGHNLLRGAEESSVRECIATPEPGELLYKLCYYKNIGDAPFGWYWGADNGGSFIVKQISSITGNKAWLTVSSKNSSRNAGLVVE